MKKNAKSYIYFTRLERLGIIGFSALLIVIIAIRASMFVWIHPEIDTEKEKKLISSWEAFKQIQNINEHSTGDNTKKSFQDALDANVAELPDSIDINTADSAILVRLKGIGPATAGKIVAKRKESGPFTNIDQLLEVRHFPDATFKILKGHLYVGMTKK